MRLLVESARTGLLGIKHLLWFDGAGYEGRGKRGGPSSRLYWAERGGACEYQNTKKSELAFRALMTEGGAQRLELARA
jgi:hypothetical protein